MAEEKVLNVNKKWEAYGNNYFWLETNYDSDIYQLDGIMREMPTISMSTEWANAPAAELGEKLDSYLNNDMLQFVAAKNEGENGGRMIAMDAMTARIYKNCTPPSFNLKFRCYSGQKIGAYEVRNAQEWMFLLGLTTPIDSNCGFSVKNFVGQFKGAGNGIKHFFESLGKKKDKNESSDVEMPLASSSSADDNMSAPPEPVDFGKNTVSVDIENPEAKYQTDADLIATHQSAQELITAVENFENMPHKGRVLNDKAYKTYGSHLFNLRIMPFVYMMPLTVYISSWSVTPSREWNTTVNDHYYYDFTLTCQLDQVPSSKTWRNIFGINHEVND